MPAGGFGNLIALPLQSGPRQNNNSVFVDEELRPHDDQWAYLSSLRRMSRAEVASLVEQASAAGRIVGVRLPLDDDDVDALDCSAIADKEPRNRLSARSRKASRWSRAIRCTSTGARCRLHLVDRLIRLAAFQNPEFYAAQAMRLPTFDKPRVISCAELFTNHIALPRGCFDAVIDLLTANGIRSRVA